MEISRSIVAALILAAGCLLSSVRLILDAPRPAQVRTLANEIPDRSDRRFSGLKSALPKQGIVGYIGESGNISVTTGAYYLTQYALAPLVVDHSPHHELVVGNFPSSSPSAADLQGLSVLKDFGNGVLLLAGKDIR